MNELFLFDSQIPIDESSVESPQQTEDETKKELILLNRSNVFAHALMNVALFSANANQLKNLVENPAESSTLLYKLSLYFIIASLILQCLLKFISLIFSCINFNCNGDRLHKIKIFKNFTIIFTLLITLVNLSVTGFVFLDDIFEIIQ